MNRRAVVAVLVIAGCSGPEEDSIEQLAVAKLDPPVVTVLGTTDSSIQLQVCAGGTGAKAGFTVQWISAAGRAAGGWEGNAERCDGSFSGQASSSSFSLAANQCTTIELGTDHVDAPGVTLSCGDVDCRQRYVVRAFAHAYTRAGTTWQRSEFTDDVPAATARCARGGGRGPARDVQTALGRLSDVEIADLDDDGVPRFVQGDLGHPGLIRDDDPQLADAALRPALPDAVAPFRLDANALALRKVSRDDDGARHFRYQQKHNGLDVIGGDLVVNVDAKGAIYAVNGTARGDIWPDVGARPVGELTAVDAVANDPRFVNLAQGPVRTVYLNADGDFYLAYEIEVSGERPHRLGGAEPVRDLVYVDADTGAIVAVHPQIHSAKNRSTYTANHGTSLPGTLLRSEAQGPVLDEMANYAHDNAGITYDAYKLFFNRDSYNNAGAPIWSSVHYSVNYCNAFWNGTQMVYGDGNGADCLPLATALDVTGHELTHAVTENESGLTYSGESGGINESLSDVFGAFTEAFNAGGASGVLVTDTNTWLIAEQVLPPFLRSMCDPQADGASLDFWTSSAGNVDVHYSSGIGNLMFCLLANGGTHPRGKSSVQVTGLGMDKAIRIVYRASADVLTSSSNYAAYRTAMLTAASGLYGADSPETLSVGCAFAAVGIGTCGSQPLPPPEPTETLLVNGVPVTNLSGATASLSYFRIDVPNGQASLTVKISGGTGDADLYVKYGSKPTTTSYTCRPYLNGNTETCTFTNPAAGSYYIMLRAYTSYSGVSLVATYGAGSTLDPLLVNGVPVTNIAGASGSAKYWRISVPAARHLSISIAGGSGDADLYTRWGSRPTTTSYNCRPYLNGNNETCTVNSTVAGDYYIMLRGYTSYSGVSLVAAY